MRQNADPVASERNSASAAERVPATDAAPEVVPLAAELVARLTASRRIGAADLPELVESMISIVRTILNPAREVSTGASTGALPENPTPKKRRGRPPGPKKIAGPPKKRGRPRKTAVTTEIATPTAAPVAPRLIRRSQAGVSPVGTEAALEPPPSSVVRGVVRWFDPARRSGGVRLTGLPEDMAVEPEIFAAANITRVFKGQEIEAEIHRGGGRVQITSLRIPGGTTASSHSGPIAATGGRRPRIVMVEKKLDALKRVAARSEAEHVLGSGSKGKN